MLHCPMVSGGVGGGGDEVVELLCAFLCTRKCESLLIVYVRWTLDLRMHAQCVVVHTDVWSFRFLS